MTSLVLLASELIIFINLPSARTSTVQGGYQRGRGIIHQQVGSEYPPPVSVTILS